MVHGLEAEKLERLMAHAEATAVVQARATATADVDVRYSFTAQYLVLKQA
jgi:hypothetical protein